MICIIRLITLLSSKYWGPHHQIQQSVQDQWQELHQVLSLGFGDVLYTESKVILKLGLGPPGWELLFQGHPTVV